MRIYFFKPKNENPPEFELGLAFLPLLPGAGGGGIKAGFISTGVLDAIAGLSLEILVCDLLEVPMLLDLVLISSFFTFEVLGDIWLSEVMAELQRIFSAVGEFLP